MLTEMLQTYLDQGDCHANVLPAGNEAFDEDSQLRSLLRAEFFALQKADLRSQEREEDKKRKTRKARSSSSLEISQRFSVTVFVCLFYTTQIIRIVHVYKQTIIRYSTQ